MEVTDYEERLFGYSANMKREMGKAVARLEQLAVALYRTILLLSTNDISTRPTVEHMLSMP